MSWKDDLEAIKEQNVTLLKMLQVLTSQVALASQRTDKMRALVDEMVKSQGRAADRMADRIIEMALVNQGQGAAAVSHRRSLDEKLPEGTDLWEDKPETQWPPPGCTAVDM